METLEWTYNQYCRSIYGKPSTRLWFTAIPFTILVASYFMQLFIKDAINQPTALAISSTIMFSFIYMVGLVIYVYVTMLVIRRKHSSGKARVSIDEQSIHIWQDGREKIISLDSIKAFIIYSGGGKWTQATLVRNNPLSLLSRELVIPKDQLEQVRAVLTALAPEIPSHVYASKITTASIVFAFSLVTLIMIAGAVISLVVL